ncbi:MAG: hypothetical protein WBL61_18220 [Bryobacteraceae bacterium]
MILTLESLQKILQGIPQDAPLGQQPVVVTVGDNSTDPAWITVTQ